MAYLEIERLERLFSPTTGVKQFDFSAERGEFVSLLGPSGCGKTTVLRMVAGFERPTAGIIRLDGRDVTALPAREAARYRRREMGFVRQELELMSGFSAIDNATIKLLDARTNWRAARRRVEPLLKQLGLAERLDHGAQELSRGEAQRVLIARALSTDPKLVLADEPTGSLDSRRSRETLTLLSEVCRTRPVAMLLVTHDPQAAAFATRVHTLRDGRLHEYEPDAALVGAGGDGDRGPSAAEVAGHDESDAP